MAKIEWIEIEDERIPENPSEKEKMTVLETEGKRLLARIPKDAHLITMEIEGKPMSSPEFADYLTDLANYGVSRIYFVIGGSLGLSPAVKARAQKALSFSPMTFPHQLVRVMLIEQVYRALTIGAHLPYHK
jgi:23S rRNA (pseudouridine1915-N3)-methyltransferase